MGRNNVDVKIMETTVSNIHFRNHIIFMFVDSISVDHTTVDHTTVDHTTVDHIIMD